MTRKQPDGPIKRSGEIKKAGGMFRRPSFSSMESGNRAHAGLVVYHRPPPLPLLRPPPPPPLRNPPPFPLRDSFRGRASFTVMFRPLRSVPFRLEIALSASDFDSISTNPKPLDLPEYMSLMTLADVTFPNWEKVFCRSESLTS